MKKERACVNCGHPLDAAVAVSPLNDKAPEPGDIAICLDCAHVMVYADDMTPREPTPEEAVEIANDPELILGLAMLEARRGMT